MKHVRGWQIFLVVVACLFVVWTVVESQQPQKPWVRVSYDPAEGENVQAYDFLHETRVLDEMADLLNDRLTEPLTLTLRTMACGVPNAYYSSKNKEVRICYELLLDTAELYVERGEDTYDVMTNTMHFILYHEVGHALVDAYRIPITGREEDAVDQLAIMVFAENEMDDALYASAVFFRARADDTNVANYWSEHSFDEQRYYNILCWAYGKDPEKYDGAISEGGLPESRAEGCEFEYWQLRRSWQMLMEPYVT